MSNKHFRYNFRDGESVGFWMQADGMMVVELNQIEGEREKRWLVCLSDYDGWAGFVRAVRQLDDKRRAEMPERVKTAPVARFEYIQGHAPLRPSDFVRIVPKKLSDIGQGEADSLGLGDDGIDGPGIKTGGWFSRTWRNLKRDIGIGA